MNSQGHVGFFFEYSSSAPKLGGISDWSFETLNQNQDTRVLNISSNKKERREREREESRLEVEQCCVYISRYKRL